MFINLQVIMHIRKFSNLFTIEWWIIHPSSSFVLQVDFTKILLAKILQTFHSFKIDFPNFFA